MRGRPARDPLEGTPYRTLRGLGGGGMGEVLLAEHRELRSSYVVKLLRRGSEGDAQLVDRFRLEGQALGRLAHPHIVSLKGAGIASDGRPFIVLERLEGRTLGQELRARGNRIPVLESLTYTCQILQALAEVHRAGLVHRDLQPENVFVCRSAEGSPCIKLLDFGVARVLPDAPPRAPAPLLHTTEEGALVGTPKFASPEAALGRRVDEAADVYAAALLLYEMLTGRGPFDHVGQGYLLSAHALATPEPPSRYALEPVAPELDALVLRALAKDPNARFATADEFREALDDLAAAMRKPQGWLDTTACEEEEAGLAGDGDLAGEGERAGNGEVAADDDAPAPFEHDLSLPPAGAINARPRSLMGTFVAAMAVSALIGIVARWLMSG